MNNKPRWVNLLVIYLAILIPLMIGLYVASRYIELSTAMLWLLGLLGSGLALSRFSHRIF